MNPEKQPDYSEGGQQANSWPPVQTAEETVILEESSPDDIEWRLAQGLHRAIRDQLKSKENARKFYPEGIEPTVQAALNHYSNRIFLWDTELIAEVMAKLGSKEIVDWAAYSLLLLTEKMRDDGFISNMQYVDQAAGFHIWKIERFTFMTKEGSDYSQPAFLPTAIKAVFEGYLRVGDEASAWEFLEQIMPRASQHIDYFKIHRAMSATNQLVFNIHKHEHGRDSSGSSKKKLPRLSEGHPLNWLLDNTDTVQDLVITLGHNIRLRWAKWDLEKAKRIYGRQDVMFNVVLAKNSAILGYLYAQMADHYPDLASEYRSKEAFYKEYAGRLEQAIYKHMWFKDKLWSPKKDRTLPGTFHSLRKNGQPEKTIDIGDLMPILLPRLRADQLMSVVNLFGTSFNSGGAPPSAPKDVSYYDPHSKRKTGCNWSGSAWVIMIKLASEGFRLQADRFIKDPRFLKQFSSQLEADQTQYMCSVLANTFAGIAKELTSEVYAEQYDSENMAPQRRYIKIFGMAMQAEIVTFLGQALAKRKENSVIRRPWLSRQIGRMVNAVAIKH